MYSHPKGLHAGPVSTAFPRAWIKWWGWGLRVLGFPPLPRGCSINDFAIDAERPEHEWDLFQELLLRYFFLTADVRDKLIPSFLCY